MPPVVGALLLVKADVAAMLPADELAVCEDWVFVVPFRVLLTP